MRQCVFNDDEVEKALPHVGHTWGFSPEVKRMSHRTCRCSLPVWVRVCRLNNDGRSNIFPHTSHVHDFLFRRVFVVALGFSLVLISVSFDAEESKRSIINAADRGEITVILLQSVRPSVWNVLRPVSVRLDAVLREKCCQPMMNERILFRLLQSMIFFPFNVRIRYLIIGIFFIISLIEQSGYAKWFMNNISSSSSSSSRMIVCSNANQWSEERLIVNGWSESTLIESSSEEVKRISSYSYWQNVSTSRRGLEINGKRRADPFFSSSSSTLGLIAYHITIL